MTDSILNMTKATVGVKPLNKAYSCLAAYWVLRARNESFSAVDVQKVMHAAKRLVIRLTIGAYYLTMCVQMQVWPSHTHTHTHTHTQTVHYRMPTHRNMTLETELCKQCLNTVLAKISCSSSRPRWTSIT
jgi:hypothetical protein